MQRSGSVQHKVILCEYHRIGVGIAVGGELSGRAECIAAAFRRGDKHLVRGFDIDCRRAAVGDVQSVQHKLHLRAVICIDGHCAFLCRAAEHIYAFLRNGEFLSVRGSQCDCTGEIGSLRKIPLGEELFRVDLSAFRCGEADRRSVDDGIRIAFIFIFGMFFGIRIVILCSDALLRIRGVFRNQSTAASHGKRRHHAQDQCSRSQCHFFHRIASFLFDILRFGRYSFAVILSYHPNMKAEASDCEILTSECEIFGKGLCAIRQTCFFSDSVI